jgi:hypothetical protein
MRRPLQPFLLCAALLLLSTAIVGSASASDPTDSKASLSLPLATVEDVLRNATASGLLTAAQQSQLWNLLSAAASSSSATAQPSPPPRASSLASYSFFFWNLDELWTAFTQHMTLLNVTYVFAACLVVGAMLLFLHLGWQRGLLLFLLSPIFCGRESPLISCVGASSLHLRRRWVFILHHFHLQRGFSARRPALRTAVTDRPGLCNGRRSVRHSVIAHCAGDRLLSAANAGAVARPARRQQLADGAL